MNPALLARCQVTTTTTSTNGENERSLHDLVVRAVHLRRRRTLPILLRYTTINNSTESPLRIVPSASDLLPDLFEDFLETRVAPKRVEIGIMLDPCPIQVIGERDKTLQQIQSAVRFAKVSVGACCVIEGK